MKLTPEDLKETSSKSKSKSYSNVARKLFTSPNNEATVDNVQTGKRGEKYIFEYFQDYYEKKYDAKAKYIKEGFKLFSKKIGGMSYWPTN